MLTRIGLAFSAASRVMSEHSGRVPQRFTTLTSVDERIRSSLEDLATARVALADAARIGAECVADLMAQSDALDAQLAAGLSESFVSMQRGD